VAQILARVLEREPDWTRLPADVPPRIRELLRRCLQKDAKKRRQTATDVRFDLEEATEPQAAAVPLPSGEGAAKRRVRVAGFVATLATAAAVALAIPYFRSAEPSPPEMRLQITTPATSSPLHFALSPDGRSIVFVASGDGGPDRLWLRPLDKTDPQPMPGTEGAQFPFWSPDSRSIGFFASSKLYRIDIAGGPPQALADAPAGRGGSWSRDGVIVFGPTGTSPLLRIAASGGEPVPLTKLDASRQFSHRLPHFLPDGRHFLFYATGNLEGAGIYLGSLDGEEPKRLAANDTAAAYLAPDRVVFVRQGTLVARQFDVERGELTGDPETLADPVGEDPGGFALGGFSVSADGRVAHRAGGGERRQLTWYDRTGKTVRMASRSEGFLRYPELSPDGRRVAVDLTVQNNRDVWLMDLERGGSIRFTFDAGIDGAPVWSPDGARIAFRSARKGAGDLYVKPSSGAGTEELVLETPNNKWPQDWSMDGRFLLYYETDPKTGWDLKALDMSGAREAQARQGAAVNNASPTGRSDQEMSGAREAQARQGEAVNNASPAGRSNQAMTGNERKPVTVVNTPFEESHGQFSLDGRWVAYATNESGRFEIVVQPFPEPTGKWQVSTGGGREPRWRADGRELYFIALDGKVMAASIATSGSTFQAGTPVALFATRIAGTAGGNTRPQYAVSRDGRFLINELAEEATVSPITLILNWKPKP
jgi:Tol biopolymer transport system component